MRAVDYNGSAKALNLSGSTIFSASELPFAQPGRNIAAFHFTLGGTVCNPDNITRLVIKANGVNIVDLTGAETADSSDLAELRSFNECFMPSNLAQADTVTRFSVWFSDLSMPFEDLMDTVGFPLNTAPQIEITLNATPTNPVCTVGWTLTDIIPNEYPVIYGLPTGYAASSTNARLNFVEPGRVRGIAVRNQATGYTRFRLVVNDKQRFHGAPTTWLNSGDYRYPATITDPIWLRIPGPESAIIPGKTYLEFDSGGGGLATDRMLIYATRPQMLA